MGKQRRKFETGFKQQIIQEVGSVLLSVSAASRKYQIAGSVIDREDDKPGKRTRDRALDSKKGFRAGEP